MATAAPAAPSAPAGPVASPAAAAVAPAPLVTEGIPIILKNVVVTMPDSIKKRLDKKLSGSETFQISYAEALRQLPSGSVKIPFREIVRMVPSTFLTPDEEMLNTQISLPLGEILPRIKTLPRRSSQRQIEVPDDVEGMFGPKGEMFKAKPAEVAAPATVTGTAPIPAGSTPPVRPPVAQPVPRPAPTPAPAAPAASGDKTYVPPEPKPLEPQKPIAFKLESTPAAAAPAAAAPAAPIAPISPISPISPAPTPIAPVPQAPRPLAAPSPPGSTPPPQPKAAFAPPPPAPAEVSDQPTISLGEVFGVPEKTNWTPQEVVQKASALRGVAGSIITTADGLAVAFQLPEHLNGNVIGAFVPQMFTRITQYTRDLKLGDAKHLTVIVENVPLQIFKSGKIFFTALGKPGENLPKPQLTAIAAALARQL